MSGAIEIRVHWRKAGLDRFLEHLSPKRQGQAFSKAVNDTAKQVERQAERLVYKALSSPMPRTKQGIFIRPLSSAGTLTATVNGSASPIPLKAFNARETPAGTKAKIWGATRVYGRAFMKGGRFPNRVALAMGDNVFERVGSARTPIKKVPGASIAQAMSRGDIRSEVEKHADERLLANVMRQMDRYSAKARGRF